MRRPAIICAIGLLAACAAGPRPAEVYSRPADFVGQRIEVCGVLRFGGLYPPGDSGPFTFLQVLGAPPPFYDVAHGGPACLTGTITRLDVQTGPDDICIDYCATHGLVLDAGGAPS